MNGKQPSARASFHEEIVRLRSELEFARASLKYWQEKAAEWELRCIDLQEILDERETDD